MNALTYPQIAATVLGEIRAIYPTGRKPDPDIADAWARVIARSHVNLPAAVWREAVTTWAVSHSEPPTPHDLVTAARQVAAQWESDPTMRLQLDEFRREVLAAKFGPDYGAEHAGRVKQVETKALAGRWRKIRAELQQRTQDTP